MFYLSNLNLENLESELVSNLLQNELKIKLDEFELPEQFNDI